jgi:hypothetical protein
VPPAVTEQGEARIGAADVGNQSGWARRWS